LGALQKKAGTAICALPVICVETRHMRAMLKAQINKTDRNDMPPNHLVRQLVTDDESVPGIVVAP